MGYKKLSKAISLLNFIRLYTHLVQSFDTGLVIFFYYKQLNSSMYIWFIKKISTKSVRRYLLSLWVKQLVSSETRINLLTLPVTPTVTPCLNLTVRLQQYSTVALNKNLTISVVKGLTLLKLFLTGPNPILFNHYLSYYLRYLFYMNSSALCVLYTLINSPKLETWRGSNPMTPKTLFTLNLQTL